MRNSRVPLTSLEADWVMMVAIAATLADGMIDPAESVRLRMLAYLNPMYREVSSVEEYIRLCARAVKTRGPWSVGRRAARVLPQALCELAYACAAEMIYAGKGIHPSEHEFLSHLRKELKIPGELAGKINAVSAIRSRSG
ncbi:MAG: hypothetical protein AUJ52_08085 [Elusimicrobia bacterium CG1_02_63_36]|nr:MAG: hypothetical protein AUJ52_08085 [Elusimicrobia bacterium CG1_02_63_36]PJA14446.1 MAG: hypothetical protein COX66_12495 [Elusimicrobia bacterium CG_4_10_14_0_2_um_filter_63_34]PJB27088.1 MAG: hypothetical protein CO113_00210 [Elusimicrobia bacterium CG_4_9_14_3_um_filter_62_55]